MSCQVIGCQAPVRRGLFCPGHHAMLPRKHRRRLRGRPPFPAKHISLAIKWLAP